ncbi:hypothetical protein ERJ75_001007800 [Trypanosoma vivax]|uniref:Uncharacterized protein n=1 Tax=Trypanosoma vivax (strain Y486) TaxID=1055687 RepID=F9WKE5_TRYVY|nr:hypothetical protein ERJ75_001007800 [Trypanosoma vivax]CCD17965.1 hypothetical protein, conserved [Trypanosoma vivax Y486]|eukprot:CCD17965.1 hypothetical protein, conserved [Trypanosoma vivax Y486]
MKGRLLGRCDMGGMVPMVALMLVLLPCVSTTGVLERFSQHSLTFSGSGWKDVYDNNESGLKSSIEADISKHVQRFGTFNTTVEVVWLGVTDVLEAHVEVLQVLKIDYEYAKLQHIWDENEVNSLISQAMYENTLSLHNKSDAKFLGSRRRSKDVKFGECTRTCQVLILMTSVLVTVMIVSLCIVLVYCCCPSCFGKQVTEEEETEKARS